MRIGVLNNLSAGGSGTRAAKVAEHASRYPGIVQVTPSASAGVADAVREFAEAGVDLIAVNGGDGSLLRCLTELLGPRSPYAAGRRALPLVAPLRSGRTCVSAYDIGSPRDPREAIDRLVAWARADRVADHVVRRASLRMTLDPDGADLWGMFFGVGVIYRGTLITHRMFPDGRARGAFGSTVVTAGLIARALTGRSLAAPGEEESPLRIDPIGVRLDGEELGAGEFQLLLATTLSRLIGGMRPFWGRGPGGIRFTGLKPGCLGLPADIARVLRGRVPKGADRPGSLFYSRNVERVDLTLDCGITLDGEMFAPLAGRRASLVADHRVRFVSTR